VPARCGPALFPISDRNALVGLAQFLDVDLGQIAAGGLERAQQILGMQDADDVLGRPAPQRQAGDGRGQDGADDLLGRVVGVFRRV